MAKSRRRPAEPPRRRTPKVAIAFVGVAVAVLLAWLATSARRPPTPSARVPSGTAAPSPIAYVPNDRCVSCHEAAAKQWAGSHHFHAMGPATETNVLGDFSGAELTHAGVTSRFFRRDGKFFVRTGGPDGTLGDFEVAYTFGVDPLQQYLVPLPGGRLQALTIAWDTRRRRWFHLLPDEHAPPGDVLHWTGRYQSWNTMCASCHSTNLRKGYDAATDRFDTTWSEVNVSCQSCHGPGERHVAWAAGGREAGADRGLVVDFRKADAAREVDLCATCHARRAEIAAAPVPGDALYDDYLPALLTADLYHPDGQQLGEVYEYGSFRQSRMYQAGVRCTDCHEPHGLELRAQRNALCVRCHQETPDTARFPGLRAGTYDSPEHHHHRAGGAGSACVDCHMPARTYMLIDPRRDHSIRIPRPDLTPKIGTPNACTGCHADQSAAWAAAAVVRWYGPERGPAHYGEVIAAGRSGRPGAEAGLATLAGDPATPAIVRATALDLLEHYGPGSVSARPAAVHDPDPAVRTAAVASLDPVPAAERVAIAAPLLGDPVRAVRIEAARVLSSAPAASLASVRPAFDRALAELVAAQNASLDMPGAHLNLAVVAENQGETARAEAQYRAALRLDPDFTPARLNLSGLLNRVGRNPEAEQVLTEGVARVPDQGELQYSLGLLLAEEKRLPEAAAALGRAADLLPERARVRYNQALALQQLGRRPEAEAAFDRARTQDPRDPAIVYALAVFYAQGGEWSRALGAAEQLAALVPDDPSARTLVEDLRRRAGGPPPR